MACGNSQVQVLNQKTIAYRNNNSNDGCAQYCLENGFLFSGKKLGVNAIKILSNFGGGDRIFVQKSNFFRVKN